MKETDEPSRRPVLEALREYPKNLLLATGMRFAQNGVFYIFTVFVLSYGENQLKVPKNTVLMGVILASIIGLFTIPAYGALSDRIGRKPVYLAGAFFILLYPFPFFWMLERRSAAMIWLAIMFGVNIGHDLMYGPQASYFSELFGTRVRYSGASLSYQVSSVFSGGFAPLIATALLASWGVRAVALYIMVMASITLTCTWLAPETHRWEIK
jgi:MFS family permease